MNNYLAQLVFEYSVNKKFADYDFINKVLDKLLVDELNIIEPIIQEDSPERLRKFATKYYYSKEMYVYINNMKDILSKEILYCNQIIYSSNSNLDDEYIKNLLIFQYNLSVIRVILFQLEHVKRYFKYNTSDKLEDILFDLGSKIDVRYAYIQNKICSKKCIINDNMFEKDFINDYEKNYTKYKLVKNDYRQLIKLYGLNGAEPSNRIANINSVKGIDLIINKLNVDNDMKNNLILFNNYYKMYFMVANYYSSEKLLLDPLKRYTNLLTIMREYSTEKYSSEELDKIINSYSNLPIEKKIYYGLGLTSDEYSSICRGKVKII